MQCTHSKQAVQLALLGLLGNFAPSPLNLVLSYIFHELDSFLVSQENNCTMSQSALPPDSCIIK